VRRVPIHLWRAWYIAVDVLSSACDTALPNNGKLMMKKSVAGVSARVVGRKSGSFDGCWAIWCT
jgi:hypothetical protein